MKKTLLITLVVMLGASMAFAQGGSIGIFADAGGTDCNLPDVVPGLTTYYVVHVNVPCATACQFSAPAPACMTATYLSDGAIFPVMVGNSQTGIAIGYGVPLGGPINVLTIQFFTSGTTPACCYYPVLPDPNVVSGSGEIEVVDCTENLIFATGGIGIVNADASCQCDVPAEDTTWGQVKSLYSE